MTDPIDIVERLSGIPAAAAPEPVASGYITRVRAQVEEQRRVFPSEEPDYLWRYTHGTRDVEHFEGCADLEVVRLYTRPTPTVAATVQALTDARVDELVNAWRFGCTGGHAELVRLASAASAAAWGVTLIDTATPAPKEQQ